MLQNIRTSSSRMDIRSVETHRQSAISNIENALDEGNLDADQTKRLKRLLRILNDSAHDSAGRKFDVLQVTVMPVLISMGLIKED